jgi:hypothetical protein
MAEICLTAVNTDASEIPVSGAMCLDELKRLISNCGLPLFDVYDRHTFVGTHLVGI